jgi:PAS domain S-box-containing protein
MLKQKDVNSEVQKKIASNLDFLFLLSKLGLKSLKSKVFITGLCYIGISLILICAVAYWSFFTAIDSSSELRQAASSTARTVDLLVFENIEFAKSIANDPMLVDKAEKAAEMAESIGVRAVPDAKQIEELESKYSKTRILQVDPPANQFLNEKKSAKSVFQRMFYTDRYGLNVAMTDSTEDFVQSDEAWWQEAMKTGLYIDDVGFDKPSGTWDVEICVAIPHPKTGQPNGVLKIKYNLMDAEDYIAGYTQNKTGYAFAINQAGLYVLHKDVDSRNQPISSELKKSGLLNMATSGEQAIVNYSGVNPDTRETENRIATFAKSTGFVRNGTRYPGFGWVFVVDNSHSEVYAAAYKMLGRTVLAGFLLFVILSALAYLLSSSIAKAVGGLQKVTEYVRAGDLNARVTVRSGDELEDVANGFNEMMNRLSDMVRTEMDQKQSLLLISKAVESSGDAILIRDSVRGSSLFNKTFTELTGYKPEELLRTDADFDLYNDKMVARDVLDALENGDSWNGEVELRTRAGDLVPVSVRANAIKDESGRIIGRIGIHTDITERRRMEEALLNSEEQYRLLFDTNPNPMWVYDLDVLRFLAVNEAAIQHYGYSREEYMSMTILDIRPPEDEAAVLKSLDSPHHGREIKTWRHCKKDGTIIDVEINSHPLSFGGRAAELVQSTDITARKRMEEAVKKSEVEYRNLFESASDAILILDPATEEIIEANTKACETYGFNHKEMVGMSLRRLTKDSRSADEHVTNPLLGNTGKNFETVHVRKDGTQINILASSSLIEYRGRKAVQGIARDITDRKKAEELLQQSLLEFIHLVSTVTEGDLTRRGSEADGPLSSVAHSVNRMLDNFGAMLTRVKQIGLSVTSSATEILAAAEQIAAGSQRQADEITNTSSAVEEMAASMSQVSRNAEASAEAARRALGMAEHGDRSVRDTSEAMSRIDTAVQLTAEKMRLLAKRSSEISEIIDLINDVASQTNLLSLNAAIEAAHAGEAGLGFSVVAEEIRKLAERSARATRDVGGLIKGIQNETAEALDAMEKGMKEVKGGSTLAEQARQSLQDISNVVRQSAELIEEISAASEEQARVTRNLAGAMQTVSSITLETSAGAHETAQTIQGMVSLSEQLNEAISQFKVQDNFVHPFSYEPIGPEPGGKGPRFMGLGGAD